MKRRFLFFSVAFVLAVGGVTVAAASGPQTDKARVLAARAANALDAGDLDRAETLFGRAIAADPRLPQAREGLGRVRMQRKDWAGALDELIKARTLYRELALTVLQQRAESSRREEASHQSFKDMMARFSDSGCWTERSYRHRLPQGAEMSGRVEAPDVKALPLPAGISFRIGVCLLRLGRHEAAREALLKELEVSPRSPSVYLNLAVAEWKLGHRQAALAALNRVRELGAEEPEGLRQSIENDLGD